MNTGRLSRSSQDNSRWIMKEKRIPWRRKSPEREMKVNVKQSKTKSHEKEKPTEKEKKIP